MRKRIFQCPQLHVFWSKVMTPLRHAMCFVNGKHRDMNILLQPRDFTHQTLWRNIKYLDFSTLATLSNNPIGIFVIIAVHGLSSDSVGLQSVHLILHQRNEGRNNNGNTLKHQSWNLITDRLSSTRRHQHERIMT